MRQKFVLHISGKSCSGKSTLEAALAEKIPGAYLVSYDRLKWQLAGYNRDEHRELIRALLFGLFKTVCELGLPVFLDAYMRDEEEYRAYRAVADAHGYRYVSCELTAPTEVLVERFRKRLESAKADPTRRMSVTSEELYRKNLEFRAFVPDDAELFDTSVLSTEDIAANILTRL